MDIGPVQLLVYAFAQPKFGGGIVAELQRLKERDIVRVIDALIVRKDAEGRVETLQTTDLTPEQAGEFGAIVGGLIGLGAAGQAGLEAGAEAGSEAIEERGGHVLDPETWDVLEDIPNDSAAAIVLLEHRWAIPLRGAILEEGGIPIGDLWLHPRDLVAAGLLTAEELERESQETRA